MPRPKHSYGQNHPHCLTASTYPESRVFDSHRYKRKFVQTPDDLRTEPGFRTIGYALMPELIPAHIPPRPTPLLPAARP